MKLSKMVIGETLIVGIVSKPQKGKEGEIVTQLDETTFIWKNQDGYYWIEKHLSIWSEKYFKSEKDAEKDARNNLDIYDDWHKDR
jgi:hypothetical protein